ncbi:MAG: hypothetical protein ACQET5_16215 [Halobacteriota archaeon]|uniref:hypothetical protein n=1 Tax=Natronomonas sp. TaxID=2184060 RepID=UPI00397637B8
MSVDSFETGRSETRTRKVALWVLLRANRWVLTGAIALAVFALLVSFSRVGLTPLGTIVENQNGVSYLFSAFIGTIVTGTSIVVMLNQLVLSQELGAFGDQRERMENSMAARRDVETAIDDGVSPPEPAAFLFDLASAIEARAEALEAAVRHEGDEMHRGDVIEYARELAHDARQIQENVENAEFGTFDVVWSALNFEYSHKIHAGRKLRGDVGDSLSEEARDHLDGTITLLILFSPVREHFKTLYFQWDLIELSRALLYIAVPALVVMAILNMYVDAAALPGATLGVDDLVWITSAGFVVGISPFVVFTVYVLRIATVVKRTLAIGSFVLQTTERSVERPRRDDDER